MIHAKSISAENFVTYDSARFDFKPGVSVVRGKNRSGKSLLFAGLPNLRWGAPLLRAGRGGTMFTRQNGWYQFEFDKGDVPVVIKHGVGKGKTAKYFISVGGENQEVDTQKAAFALMDELLPGSETLMSSTVYITSTKPNPMQYGTGAERMAFLETLFDMESVETLREKIRGMWEKTKHAAVELEALRAEYDAIEKPDPRVDRIAGILGKTIDTADTYLDHVEKAKRRAQSTRLLSESMNFSATAKRLKTMRKQARRELASVQEKLAAAKQDQRDAAEAKASKAAIERLNKRLSDAAGHLAALNKKHGVNIFRKISEDRVAQLGIKLRQAFDLLEALKRGRKNYFQLKRIVASFDARQAQSLKTMRRYIARANKSVETLRPYIKLMQHVKDHGKAECPTCMRIFSKSELKEQTARYEEYRMAKRLIAAVEVVPSIHEKPATKAELAGYAKEIRFLERKISATKAYLSWNAIVKQCEQELLTIKPVREVDDHDAEHRVAQLSAVVQDLKDRLSRIDADLATHEKIRSLNRDEGEPSPEPSPLTRDALNRASALHGALRQQAARASRDKSRRRDIEERMKKLSKLAERDDVLSALHNAYGPRGLRVNQMAAVADMLEGAFNSHATTFLPEPVYFQFDVAPSRVDVNVQRNAITGAASLLSGSESRLFQLLCMASVMEYLPKKFRWDTVILDEIESNMEDVTRRFLVERCLPYLVKAIDKVNIITPLPSDEFSIEGGDGFDVHEYRVTKARNRSTIEAI